MTMDWFTLIYILLANRVFARSISDSTTEDVSSTTNCYRKCCPKGSTFDPDADSSCKLTQFIADGHQDDDEAISKKILSRLTISDPENIEIIYGNNCPEHTERKFLKINEDNFTLADGQLVIHETSRNISVSTRKFCFDFDSNSQSTVVIACIEFKVSIQKCPAGQVLNSKGNNCTLPSVQAGNRNTSLHIPYEPNSTDTYYLLNYTDNIGELPSRRIKNNGSDLGTRLREMFTKLLTFSEFSEDCDFDPKMCSWNYSYWEILTYGKDRFQGFPVLVFACSVYWLAASFLATTFLVYAVLEKLRRKQSSMNTMSLLGSASVYYFLLSLAPYCIDFLPYRRIFSDNRILLDAECYFILVTFAWYKIISKDLLRMFRHVQTRQPRDSNQRRRFVYDSALAWGTPLLFQGVQELIFGLLAQQYPSIHGIVYLCRRIFVGIIVILNTISFIWVAVCYYKISIAASVSRRCVRKRLLVLFRIFLLMGVIFIMDVVAVISDNVYVVLLSFTLAMVDAILIFVTLVCKPDVLRMLQEKFKTTIDLSRKVFSISQRVFATEIEMELRNISCGSAPDLNTVASHM